MAKKFIDKTAFKKSLKYSGHIQVFCDEPGTINIIQGHYMLQVPAIFYGQYLQDAVGIPLISLAPGDSYIIRGGEITKSPDHINIKTLIGSDDYDVKVTKTRLILDDKYGLFTWGNVLAMYDKLYLSILPGATFTTTPKNKGIGLMKLEDMGCTMYLLPVRMQDPTRSELRDILQVLSTPAK